MLPQRSQREPQVTEQFALGKFFVGNLALADINPLAIEALRLSEVALAGFTAPVLRYFQEIGEISHYRRLRSNIPASWTTVSRWKLLL